MKIIKLLFILLIFIGAALAAFLFFKYRSITTSQLSSSSEKVRFEIKKGMTGVDILEALAESEIVESEKIPYLKVYLKLNNVPAMQEGVFRLPKNLTVKELFDTLQNPENPDIWVTIQEGLRVDQVADILAEEFGKEEEAVFNEAKFLSLTTDKEYIGTLGINIVGLSSLEGFLFPDKYLFPKQATEDYLIKTLVNTFLLKTGGVYTYDDIIIASMVEREGRTNDDRPMIADIIKRRYKEGSLLQIDATLLYYYKDWKHPITDADLKLDQPYNTYKRIGLPPTPICNPGLSAINASKNPKSNQYYFYLHDNSGNIYYATTYQEHLLNIQKYLR
ncbi:MAG: hypothetical protein UT34_C0002G0107 [candidate division WS6 bacterium GW2011_GWF2_39_15]|uniref:Endolytic murein transglycosylase n=1 Tax=candidate division WS6 bacterium GW2011_GWF2_39_15 TaxID=1619100 RepID=A0A0G0Q5D7_9BACT|nr:MAG: hypothetical protein UT34_C0002G0107 [candidate division WS6 bacterium GW2011_GWF2_39_15]